MLRRLIARVLSRWADAAQKRAYTSLQDQLASVRQELAETRASLRVAEHENARLWELSARDDERIKRERAEQSRARAEAIAAAQLAKTDEGV